MGMTVSAETDPRFTDRNRSSARSMFQSLGTWRINCTKCCPALYRISQRLWATAVLFGCECSHFVSLNTDYAHILGSILNKIKKFLYRTISLFVQLADVFREFCYCVQIYYFLEMFSDASKLLSVSEERHHELNTTFPVWIIFST
jgi:hypothetical protein